MMLCVFRFKVFYQRFSILMVGSFILLLMTGCGSESKENNGQYSLYQYNSLDGVYQQIHAYSQSEFVEIITIGSSARGHPILAIKLNSHKSQAAKDIIFVSGQHAREWIAPATVLLMAQDLIQNWGHAQAERDSLNIWLIPLANPDGYEYTHNSDRFWRKNRNLNGDGSVGVDLNRNYDYLWDQAINTEPAAEIYKGEHALSEPESQAIAGLVMSTDPIAVVDIHSYAQAIVTASSNERASKLAAEMADVMTGAGAQRPYRASSVTLPFYGGSLFEWADSLPNTDGYLIELLPDSRDATVWDWLEFSSPFDPPASQIKNSWTEIKPGIEHLIDYYGNLAAFPNTDQ